MIVLFSTQTLHIHRILNSDMMNSSIVLIQLSLYDGMAFYDMLQHIGKDENAFTNPVCGMSYEEYKEWLKQQDDWSRGENLPIGYVGQTVFWLMDGETPVGIGKIRHSLTESSRAFGGNIGYAISSEYRGRGYGSVLLKELLRKADEMGVAEKILTVEKYNYASKKVIENNGGKLYDENELRWYFEF